MNQLLNNLRLHSLAVLCWVVAFLFWKDYFTHPHHAVSREHLAQLTGELTLSGRLMSLPSGTGSGSFVMLEESRRSFHVPGNNFEFNRDVPRGARVTVTYSPEEDVSRSGEEVSVFSLKYGEKDYLGDVDLVASFNEHITEKRNRALGCTAAGFVAFGLVRLLQKRFLKT